MKIIYFLFFLISFFNQPLFAAEQHSIAIIQQEGSSSKPYCLECNLKNIEKYLLSYRSENLSENLVGEIYKYIRVKYRHIKTWGDEVIQILYNEFGLTRLQIVQIGDYACGLKKTCVTFEHEIL